MYTGIQFGVGTFTAIGAMNHGRRSLAAITVTFTEIMPSVTQAVNGLHKKQVGSAQHDAFVFGLSLSVRFTP